MRLRHSLALLLLSAATAPAFAHPGPHDHLSLADAIGHAVSPFHFGLVALGVTVIAGGLILKRRRARTVRSRTGGRQP